MSAKAWPTHLAPGAVRIAHRTSRFEETVDFYGELVGLPLIDDFNDSYGLDGAILAFRTRPSPSSSCGQTSPSLSMGTSNSSCT